MHTQELRAEEGQVGDLLHRVAAAAPNPTWWQAASSVLASTQIPAVVSARGVVDGSMGEGIAPSCSFSASSSGLLLASAPAQCSLIRHERYHGSWESRETCSEDPSHTTSYWYWNPRPRIHENFCVIRV